MKRYAISSGCNIYKDLPRSKLNGCVPDAKAGGSLFESYDYEVTYLFDSDATRTNEMEAMRELASKAKYGDRIAHWHAGHGSYTQDVSGDEPDHRDEGWCSHDIRDHGKLILDDEIHEIYSKRKRGVRLFIASDTCFSGTVSRAAMPTPETDHAAGAPFLTALRRFMPPEEFLGEHPWKLGKLERAVARGVPVKSPELGTAIQMGACQDNEFSYDCWIGDAVTGYFQGAFTEAAMRAHKNLFREEKLNRGRRVVLPFTYREWFDQILKEIPAIQVPQHPNLYGTNSRKNWRALA